MSSLLPPQNDQNLKKKQALDKSGQDNFYWQVLPSDQKQLISCPTCSTNINLCSKNDLFNSPSKSYEKNGAGCPAAKIDEFHPLVAGHGWSWKVSKIYESDIFNCFCWWFSSWCRPSCYQGQILCYWEYSFPNFCTLSLWNSLRPLNWLDWISGR